MAIRYEKGLVVGYGARAPKVPRQTVLEAMAVMLGEPGAKEATWLPLRTQGRREITAAAHLLADGNKLWVPMLYGRRKCGVTGVRDVASAMFPGLGFLRCSGDWERAFSTPGVEGLLSVGASAGVPFEQLWIVHEMEMQKAGEEVRRRALERMRKMGAGVDPRTLYTVGEQVMIRLRYADLLANIEGFDEAGRIAVAYKLFGGERRSLVTAGQVMAV